MLVGVLDTPLPVARIPPPPFHTTMFPCIALAMPFSRDTLTELNMTLVRLSGAKSLRDPVVSQLLGEWVASSPLARARTPPPPSQAASEPPSPQPAPQKRKFSFESSDESDDGAIHWAKKPNPPPHHHRTAYEGRPRPQTHQPPLDRHRQPPPPHPHQDRHPQGCREEGRPSRGSDRRGGRPRTLPHRSREGHRPWYPRAEVRCRLGGIPRRHHPLQGGPAPPLPHPRGGRAAPGSGPGAGQEKGQTPRPHKRSV